MSENEVDRAAIQAQLERILANPLFKNSKRYPSRLYRHAANRACEQADVMSNEAALTNYYGSCGTAAEHLA